MQSVEEIADIMDSLSELGVATSRRRIAIDDPLSSASEDDCMEVPEVGLLAMETSAQVVGECDNIEEDEPEVSYLEKMSYSEQMRCLVVSRHLVEHHDLKDQRLHTILCGLQRKVKHTQASQRQQTKITSFFN